MIGLYSGRKKGERDTFIAPPFSLSERGEKRKEGGGVKFRGGGGRDRNEMGEGEGWN